MTDFQFILLQDWLSLSPVFRGSIEGQRQEIKLCTLAEAVQQKVGKLDKLPIAELTKAELAWLEKAKWYLKEIEDAG